jgi:4,5-dihydroxyphthalate decarboxylase
MMAGDAFKVVLGDHASVRPLKSGEIRLPGADLDFVHYDVTHDAFKPMVNGQAFDICEMAMTTLVMAKAHGRPLHMLPAVMIGRLQQPYAAVNAGVDMRGPADIAGKRIGVRSYAQTTVTWLRGILKCDYCADLDSAHWVSFEDGHIPEAPDPTERAPAGRKMAEMLYAGDLDIALGLKSDDVRAKPLFPDAAEAGAQWFARHQCFAINHVIAVTDDMVCNHLDVIVQFYAALKQGKAQAAHTDAGPDPRPMGFAGIERSLEVLITYANALELLPGPITANDLIDPRLREALGQ